MWIKLIVLVGLTALSNCRQVPEGFKYSECDPVQEECVYYLKVQEQLTMIYHKDLVYPFKGKLYKYDETPGNNNTHIPIEDVVTVDGVNRMAIAVNGTIPGPPIVVYEGQKVTVHVRNLLLSDSVTIHWHGLHQKSTPHMDGVGWVTQCPIGSGQTFTYRFEARPKGTFWYHSHVGSQRTNGVYGALIIKERPTANQNKEPPTDVIMQVSDWHHESSEEVYVKMIYGNFKGRVPYQPTRTIDGGRFSGVPWVSGLIEGRGRYMDPKTGKHNEAPLTQYNVKSNTGYRFRVINVGSIYPMRVSVDAHSISVVASDGYDVVPVLAESVIVHPGERFDFLLRTDQSVGNYWIRSISLEHNVTDHYVLAVLHYQGAPDREPTTWRDVCTSTDQCKVVNCPFLFYPKDYNIKCITLDELKNQDSNDLPPEFKEESEEHFLNFAFPGEKVTPGSVNGRKFEFPGVNSLHQDEMIGSYECDKHDCGDDKICYCHYQLDVPYNKTVQIVASNIGNGGGWGHPIHIHGHSFYVMKVAFPELNETTSEILDPLRHPHLDCGSGSKFFCNSPKWKDRTWGGDNLAGINTQNPPRKDTIIIPSGGYAVLRIRTDNPGKWFMHCHIEVHALDGMAMILSEAQDRIPEPPPGFPVCRNFYNDQTRDMDHQPTVKCDDPKPYKIALITVSVCLAIAVVALFTILVRKRSLPKDPSNTNGVELHSNKVTA